MISARVQATMCLSIPVPEPKEIIEKAKKLPLKTEKNLLVHSGSTEEKKKYLTNVLTEVEFHGKDLILKNPLNIKSSLKLRSDLIPIGSEFRILSYDPIKAKGRMGNESDFFRKNSDFDTLITFEFSNSFKVTSTLKEFFHLVLINNMSGMECSSRDFSSSAKDKGNNILNLLKHKKITKSSTLSYLYCFPNNQFAMNVSQRKIEEALSAFGLENEVVINAPMTALNMQDKSTQQTCYPLSFASSSSFITAMYYFPGLIGGE